MQVPKTIAHRLQTVPGECDALGKRTKAHFLGWVASSIDGTGIQGGSKAEAKAP